MILVGTKSDLEERKVSTAEGEAMAAKMNVSISWNQWSKGKREKIM